MSSNKKTGTSMGGSIEYTNSVRPIPCDCFTCFHAQILNKTHYCSHYGKYNPKKTKCARFSAVPGKNLRPRPPKKKKKKKKAKK